MKVASMIVLALFSFLHEEKYPVQSICENNQIKVQYENEWYDVQLFNVFVEEEANVCSYIEEEATIVFDSYAKIENPLNVYFFIGEKMLQQTLIDENKASIKINNPNYQYILKENQEETVIATVEEGERSYVSYSRYIAYGFIVAYLILCLLLYKRKRKNKKRSGEELQD